MIFAILFVAALFILLGRKRKTRLVNIQYGTKDNVVVSGRAAFRCGCILYVGGIQLCGAHRAMADNQ